MRCVNDLALVRSSVPMFALTLTMMHTIDETSPLYGHTATRPDGWACAPVRVGGVREIRQSTRQSTTSRPIWRTHVRFGMKYADAVTVDPNGRTMADLTRISLLEPDGTDMAEGPELRAVQ